MKTDVVRVFFLRRHAYTLFIAVLLLSGIAPAPALATPAAPAVEATLCLGQATHQTWDVFVRQYPLQADILVVMDTTGSLGGEIQTLRDSFLPTILPGVLSRFPDVQWGVAELKDYEIFGNTDPPFPYRLVQDLTPDANDVYAALNTLTAVGGGDPEEAYTRGLYESFADTAIHWRPGVRHFVVMYGDALPHEPDPGRDGLLGTGDDLTMAAVLAAMHAEHITLLYVNSGDPATTATWQAWAAQTESGGDARTISSTGTDLPAATVELLLTAGPQIDSFALQADPPEYQSWLATAPASYTSLVIPEGGITLTFGIDITLPAATTLGHDYLFDLVATGNGVPYATRPETIHPRSCAYVPLCQFGIPVQGMRVTP